LKTKLAVKTTAVEPFQSDPCSILVSFAGWAEQLVFPFPINVEKSRVRIARKQSYIEVLVPPWVPSHKGCYTSNPFSAIISENGPLLFNMPKLALDRLPKLEPTKKMDWLETHAAMTLSARERRIRHPSQTSNDGLLNVKENLHALFVTMSTSSSSSSRSGRIFGLCHPQKGGIYTLILVSSIRLDLSAHTVVADAHILPLSQSVIRGISRFLQDHQKDVRALLVSDEGAKMWSIVLAVSVERCREGIWEHQKVCEYKKVGKFPTSTTPGVLSLCSCGRGQALSAFISCKAYEPLIPYVHRAAIGLIFAVPFYEQLFMGA